MPGSRKLGRESSHRLAMLRGMVTYLFETGRIETTVTRAKEVRALAEKMITMAKVNTLANKKNAMAFITKEDVVKKLFDEIAPMYAQKSGGYTRLIKTGTRRGDAAEMCFIELIGYAEKKKADEKKADKKTSRRAKKQEEAEKKPVSKKAPEPEEDTAEED